MSEKRRSNRRVQLPLIDGFIPLTGSQPPDLAVYLQQQPVIPPQKPVVTVRPPIPQETDERRHPK